MSEYMLLIFFLFTSLAEIEELITKNGGKIVELDNPKLTHIVLDQRDVGRRIELMTRTSKYVFFFYLYLCILLTQNRPKRRNIVISDWIQACLDEETLLDEECECSNCIYRRIVAESAVVAFMP